MLGKRKSSVEQVPYHPSSGSLLHHPNDAVNFSHYEDPKTGARLEHDEIWPRLPEPIQPAEPFRHGRYFIQTHGPQQREYVSVNTAPTWRDNLPFHATLQVDHTISGRSAKYVIWKNAYAPLDRRTYPMFVTDLLDVARFGIQPGGIVSGRWIVRKRGQNYGLAIAPEEAA